MGGLTLGGKKASVGKADLEWRILMLDRTREMTIVPACTSIGES